VSSQNVASCLVKNSCSWESSTIKRSLVTPRGYQKGLIIAKKFKKVYLFSNELEMYQYRGIVIE
jgi:hypothetical protein